MMNAKIVIPVYYIQNLYWLRMDERNHVRFWVVIWVSALLVRIGDVCESRGDLQREYGRKVEGDENVSGIGFPFQ